MERGDLVLCVCDFSKFVNQFDEEINYPKPGKYYLIRECKKLASGKEAVTLEEIYNDRFIDFSGDPQEITFDGLCFTKMPTPDISELKNLLK